MEKETKRDMEIAESYIDIGYKLLNELEEKCADSSLTAASTLKKLGEGDVDKCA